MTLPNRNLSLTKQELIQNIEYVLSSPDRGELLDINWLKDLLISVLEHLDNRIDISIGGGGSVINPTSPSEAIQLHLRSLKISIQSSKPLILQVFQSFIDSISLVIFQNEYWNVPEYPSKIINDYLYVAQYYYENEYTFQADSAFNESDYVGLPDIENSITKTYVVKLIEIFRLSVAQFESLKNWRATSIERQQLILTDIINEMITTQTYINQAQ